MIKRRYIAFFILSFLMLVSADASAISQKKFVPLKDQRNSGSSGEAEIENTGYKIDEWTVGINVYRLRPGAVYSVWLVSARQEEGRVPFRKGHNHFKADGSGNAHFVTWLPWDYSYDQWHWRYIEVYYHPDGDPNNTGDMVLVLKGDLIYGYHS